MSGWAVVARAGWAALAGVLALLVISALATVALVLTMPAGPPDAVAWMLPLLVAAMALGGGLVVDGPVAGQISMLGEDGLFGAPSGPTADGQLSVHAVPLTLTLLVAIVIVAVARRRLGDLDLTDRLLGTATAATVLAVLGLVVAALARADVDGNSIHSGLGMAALGGAVTGALGGWIGFGPRGGLRQLVGRALIVVFAAVPVAAAVVAVTDLGIAQTLLFGSDKSTGLRAVLAVLLGPGLVCVALALGLNVGVSVEGSVFGFGRTRTYGLLDAINGLPIAGLLPAASLAALLLLTFGSLSRSRGVASVPVYTGCFAVLGMLLWGATSVEVSNSYAGTVMESGHVEMRWSIIAVAAAAGAVIAVVAPFLAEHRHHHQVAGATQ